MNRVRFEELLDRFGSDLSSWPDGERIAARGLLENDPLAVNALAEARCLDRLIYRSLDQQAAPEAADKAASRILAGLSRGLPAQERPIRIEPAHAPARVWWTIALPWQQIGALGFAAALGIAIGVFSADKQAMDDQRRLIVAIDGETDLNAVLFEADPTMGTQP
jgi:hypothetical protein